ncbi:hypA-like protein [Sporothrix schenckii 1099-18]|uniref:HypA-like protein n=2 Tax=Sporothrix schenckii TaxID=29908 RepID=U7PLL2_SPOS1|nr:hypA-like protein [Sporothrix schenckii 1099-18]ERS95634.1 hypothetical protein HMPREF1624_08150 [Sporothrix schenckii ATCC 58251]KJR86653.1 hypA-like protein [Sporothrix schenckii 1099-18]
MASPTQIHVDADNTGLWRIQQTPEASDRVSSLLQQDLETHHVFFNNDGFHNHITHHLLSLYGTGADVSAIQKGYDDNKGYQREARPVHNPKEGSDPPGAASGPLADDWYETTAPQHLGHESYYPDFLRFFQHDIARRDEEANKAGSNLAGWEAVLRDRVFSGTPAAEDLRTRLFAGFLHPLIQLMYGIEWGEPAIVAQGLAQAAIHKHQGLDDVLYSMEKAADAEKAKTTGHVSILSLFQEVAQSPQLSSAAHWDDPNKMRNGVLARALNEMVAVAAKVSVPATEEGLAARTAEMAEACLYVASSAALQHPTKYTKFDFFLIHHVNSVPFFLAINSFVWLSVEAKARLLEWKIRLDLVQYASRACPPLLDVSKLEAYKSPPSSNASAHPAADGPSTTNNSISPEATEAAARLFHMEEDGHAIKLVRATGLIEREVRKSLFTRTPCRLLNSDRVWEALYRLETDSVFAPGNTYVRTTGLEQAWEDIPDISK